MGALDMALSDKLRKAYMRPKDDLKLDVIIASERDQRTLDFLISVCGLARLRRAREQLPGDSRPYISNIAKILGVTVPLEVIATPQNEARHRISDLKERLAKKKWD